MNARRTPASIWRDMGIVSPAEADVEVIAYFCGATVKYRKLDGCAARIIGRGNKAVITVDERSSPERQRFSVAHELGHWFQDRGRASFNCGGAELGAGRYRNFETDREAAANKFAVELLMPAPLFREAARNKPVTLATARELSREFRVGLTAAAIRLVELGTYPSIVVCSDVRGYKWSWRHPDLPLSVRVRRLRSQNTSAYRLLMQTDSLEEGAVQIDAEDWVDHAKGGEYVVTEDSMRISENHVLSLVWWHDESPLDDSDSF